MISSASPRPILRYHGGKFRIADWVLPPHEVYDELYADWQRHERPHMADGGRPRTEVVWLNDAAVAALEATRTQQGLFA